MNAPQILILNIHGTLTSLISRFMSPKLPPSDDRLVGPFDYIRAVTNQCCDVPTERLLLEKQKLKEASRDADGIRQKEVSGRAMFVTTAIYGKMSNLGELQ